jgi:hypothetical protein
VPPLLLLLLPPPPLLLLLLLLLLSQRSFRRAIVCWQTPLTIPLHLSHSVLHPH